MARSGDNHMKMQLHRVGLDGKGDKRLTDPAWNHSVDLAPTASTLSTSQKHDSPPATRLVNAEGKLWRNWHEQHDQMKTQAQKGGTDCVQAGDGKTELYGMLHFPLNLGPQKYPLLVTVYGAGTPPACAKFTLPSSMTESGFLCGLDCAVRVDAASG